MDGQQGSSRPRTIARAFRDLPRVWWVNPFKNIPDDVWDELTDPPSYFVGSLLTVLFPPEDHPDDIRFAVQRASRLGGALAMAIVLVAPLVLDPFLPHHSTGDALAYAITLLIAGLVTMVPGKVAELRRAGKIRGGSEYPKRRRRMMWGAEVVLLVASLVGAGYLWENWPEHSDLLLGIALGLSATILADFMVLWTARVVSEYSTMMADVAGAALGPGRAADAATPPGPRAGSPDD